MGSPPKEYWDEKLKNFPPKMEYPIQTDYEKDTQLIRLGVFGALILLWLFSLVPEKAMMSLDAWVKGQQQEGVDNGRNIETAL